MAPPFPHLNVASAYSMRYGTAFPRALVDRASEYGMDILALTDRDGLYGAVKHAQACAAVGIAPVLGVNLALDVPASAFTPVPGIRTPRPRTGPEAEDRVTVLARSGGWSRLCRLVTAAHSTGERGAPKVTRELVGTWAGGPGGDHGFGDDDGLVVLLGPRSDVGRAVAERRDEHARTLLGLWRAAVPGVV
ncbi:MAG: PHP domain-containing protein, partial [Nonomuraea sp.]|nr:PHP domain-containing protein [Nonomuraea sp.]